MGDAGHLFCCWRRYLSLRYSSYSSAVNFTRKQSCAGRVPSNAAIFSIDDRVTSDSGCL